MFGIGKYIAAGAAVTLLLAWGLRVDHLRDGWRTRYITETGTVTNTLGRVTGNAELTWENVNPQIERLANSRVKWKGVANEQSMTIDRMSVEARRRLKVNQADRARFDKIIKERTKLIDRLAEQALTPGDRENCQQQIAAVQKALDAIYEEGL